MERRDFMRQAAAGAAAVLAGAGGTKETALAQEDNGDRKMPLVRLGQYDVSRMIAGCNPISGFSHLSETLSRIMREYFTVERTVEFLKHCEGLGINTWQIDLNEKTEKVIGVMRDAGSKLHVICLANTHDDVGRIAALKPIAIAHHGGVTDTCFREGRAGEVRDFVKRARDQGVLAGVSTHNPEYARRVFAEGWENDFFMTCLYRVTRTREETLKDFGTNIPGEPFAEADRDKMTSAIREIAKPCLAFKILAAGRPCSCQEAVSDAFKYAFDNIKKTDAVIVGMFPLYADEAAENVQHTLNFA